MNKYEIIGIVGEGAYGIVYKAKNKDSGEYGKYKRTFELMKLLSSKETKIHHKDKLYYLLI
jgi:serine/threonine protein kinase